MDGGTTDFPISINDPMWGARDDATNQRLKWLYQSGEPLSIEQQRLLQALENQAGLYDSDVIIDTGERESPFPLGCPSGFFQEGNVCVPIIGTYPDETYGAPPAGENFARGVIDHIEVPASVVRGQKFSVFVFMRNIGAIRGKFGAALVIDTWSIDVVSPQGWVPGRTPAVIEIQATCPSSAVLGDSTVPATLELQKLDEVTREYTIDDLSTANIPEPTTAPPPPEPECFTWNNVEYCETTTPSGTGCLTIGTKTYCPVNQPTPQCFTWNNIEYCESTTHDSSCVQIGTKWFCPTTTPQPQCFTWNNTEYCESDEITGPNCVQIGSRIFCPTSIVPCPSGQERFAGNCVPVCPTGYERNTAGACIPSTCPAGYERNSAGVCIPVCPTGYVKSGNVCIPMTCPTGQQFDVATGTCKPIVCPTGYDLSNGHCVPKICPIGKVLDPTTGNCVPITCPTGYHLDGSTCVPNTPPPPPQCITIGGQEFCQSNEWRTGCVFQNSKIYCPPATPPPPPPPEDPATIMAPDSIHDGDSFTVKGYKFKPGETVTVTLDLVWQSERDSYDGRRDSDSSTVTASSNGSFSTNLASEEVPSGVSSVGSIKARGATSGKTAQTTINII